ncbi:hypothetical protein BDN72DRAFT_844923 [Pluteus cervinus]|uniref:Uncharacterized protein n=1 Tax=Pluteus cervinus TaxID=181527 RepID=A0ACD3AK83_9AGAR|nr:hypothetical protein BDN72DRAFT_844923 [Pluteus cervinus]
MLMVTQAGGPLGTFEYHADPSLKAYSLLLSPHLRFLPQSPVPLHSIQFSNP